MKTGLRFALLLALISSMVVSLYSFTARKAPRILVFYKTNGFKHSSIPAGIKAIQKLSEENSIRCDTTSDSLIRNPSKIINTPETTNPPGATAAVIVK